MTDTSIRLSDTQIGVAVTVGLLLLLLAIPIRQAAAITLILMAIQYAAISGWFSRLRPPLAAAWRALRQWFARKPETAVPLPYALILGRHPITGELDIESLPTLGHIGVYGATRFGKTTFIHSLIHHLITTHRPHQLRLAISDPKTVDYPFYGSLPHLFRPIARDSEETKLLIAALLDEMKYRALLYQEFNGRICNNLERYQQLSGRHLPRILAIFDEIADVIPSGSPVEADLIRLAKLGLAYGIQLIAATQRPSSRVVTGEIKSQMASKFVTWMPTAREYGVVAEIPRQMYLEMPRVPGRFIAYTANGWRYLQAAKIPDQTLERTARRLSGRPRQWRPAPVAEPAKIAAWPGDEPAKIAAIRQLAADLGHKPSLAAIRQRFQISKPTAVKYRRLAFQEQ